MGTGSSETANIYQPQAVNGDSSSSIALRNRPSLSPVTAPIIGSVSNVNVIGYDNDRSLLLPWDSDQSARYYSTSLTDSHTNSSSDGSINANNNGIGTDPNIETAGIRTDLTSNNLEHQVSSATQYSEEALTLYSDMLQQTYSTMYDNSGSLEQAPSVSYNRTKFTNDLLTSHPYSLNRRHTEPQPHQSQSMQSIQQELQQVSPHYTHSPGSVNMASPLSPLTPGIANSSVSNITSASSSVPATSGVTPSRDPSLASVSDGLVTSNIVPTPSISSSSTNYFLFGTEFGNGSNADSVVSPDILSLQSLYSFAPQGSSDQSTIQNKNTSSAAIPNLRNLASDQDVRGIRTSSHDFAIEDSSSLNIMEPAPANIEYQHQLPENSMYNLSAPDISTFPPDFYSPLRPPEHRVPPPPEDFAVKDPDNIPRRQELRFAGDMYTPMWVRKKGDLKEGWCDLCTEPRWLILKNSAYWYDKNFSHGICSLTGRRYEAPLMCRRVKANEDIYEGFCGVCRQWVQITTRRGRGGGTSWFRHANKCHNYERRRSDRSQ
ncbi:hypothetical protein V1511DRAFT_490170 [Dipodascopsis uninucleata]